MDPERKRRQDEAYKLQIWGTLDEALLNLEDPQRRLPRPYNASDMLFFLLFPSCHIFVDFLGASEVIQLS